MHTTIRKRKNVTKALTKLLEITGTISEVPKPSKFRTQTPLQTRNTLEILGL